MKFKTAIMTTAMTLAAAGTANAQMGGNDWISVTGTVAEVEEDNFILDYGTNMIEVEFDGLFVDSDVDERLSAGEQVTVYGYVDNDFLEGRVIEAESVLVRDRSTYYGGDEGEMASIYFVDPYTSSSLDGTYVTLEGKVSEIDGREFMLTSGDAEISVDTMELDYNPLDKRGNQQIEKGDRVTVGGLIDDSLFDEMELSASYIYSIENNSSMKKSNKNKKSMKTRYSDSEKRSRDGMKDKDQREATNRSSEENRDDMRRYGQEFAMIDENGDGEITQSEYVNAVSDPQNITVAEARRLFDLTARNDDVITPREFVSHNEKADEVYKQALSSEERR